MCAKGAYNTSMSICISVYNAICMSVPCLVKDGDAGSDVARTAGGCLVGEGGGGGRKGFG